jgi:hypothetical protein
LDKSCVEAKLGRDAFAEVAHTAERMITSPRPANRF